MIVSGFSPAVDKNDDDHNIAFVAFQALAPTNENGASTIMATRAPHVLET